MDVSRRGWLGLTTTLVLLAGCGRNDPHAPGHGTLPQDSRDAGPPCARALDNTNPEQQVLRFSSTTPPITVFLMRDVAGMGVGESTVWVATGFSVLANGVCASTQEPALLDYENSHHNWSDRARATLGTTRYQLEIDYVLDIQAPVRWRAALRGWDQATDAGVMEETVLLPTGGPAACWDCPNFLPVWITEVQQENHGTTRDEAGDADPWVELWNPSADGVDLSGWRLVDESTSQSWTFASGTRMERHAFLLVWMDGEPLEGSLHASFRVSATARLHLLNPPGVTIGERDFTSPGPGRSLDFNVMDRRFVVADQPTPGSASSMQQ